MPAEDVKARLAAARATKQERDAAAELAAEAHELVVLELEARLEKELGPQGVAWAMVDAGPVVGPIAVKLGEPVLYKRFQSSKLTLEDQAAFVGPCVVYPAAEVFLAVAGKQPALYLRCSNALATLFGAKEEGTRGKF